VNVVEIGRPDLDAQLTAEAIAEQLKRRASFRRTIKQRAEAIMQAGAKGVKIQVSGRLGGAEMSRTVKQIMGSIPLQTLDADVDYGFAPSFTTYGALGVKVWIHRGRYGEAPAPAEARAASSARPPRARRAPGRGARPGRRVGRGPRREAPTVSAEAKPRPEQAPPAAARPRPEEAPPAEPQRPEPPGEAKES
jgi:small subunit ribosomal protein S3